MRPEGAVVLMEQDYDDMGSGFLFLASNQRGVEPALLVHEKGGLGIVLRVPLFSRNKHKPEPGT